MKTYIIRAIKYFLSLIILLAAIYALMIVSKTNESSSLAEIFLTRKGALMMLAMVVLSAVYPYFGYVDRTIKCKTDKQKLVKFFEIYGYSLKQESQAGYLIFKSSSSLKRIKTMGEDKITASIQDEQIILQGLRKEIVRLEYRLITFMKNNEN